MVLLKEYKVFLLFTLFRIETSSEYLLIEVLWLSECLEVLFWTETEKDLVILIIVSEDKADLNNAGGKNWSVSQSRAIAEDDTIIYFQEKSWTLASHSKWYSIFLQRHCADISCGPKKIIELSKFMTAKLMEESVSCLENISIEMLLSEFWDVKLE